MSRLTPVGGGFFPHPGRVLVVVGIWFVALGVFADFFARLFPVRA
jgi:hypothetical protein